MTCESTIVYVFLGRLAAYFALLAFLVLISCLVLKCLEKWGAISEGDDERSPLMPLSYYISGNNNTNAINYGTCSNNQNDDGSSSTSNSTSTDFKSYEEFYNAKICVICYDDLRNSFFVPCGHSATCHSCALRIFDEENKKCPVCRRHIGKVKKLFTT